MAKIDSMNRYARQVILPEVGQAGQDRLAHARVLVIGAGALGIPVLQYLTGAGVGHITLLDPDTIEVSNLHRQPIYHEAQEGLHKAVACRLAMARLNSQVKMNVILEWLTPENAPQLVADADLVLDCADSYAASYTLSDCCFAAGKPLISASALGLQGYVGGFCGGAPSLRAVFPNPTGGGATCATAGVLGPVVGMIGAMQARMALGHLLGITPSPLGMLMRLDSDMRVSQFRFDDAPEPDGPRFISRLDVRKTDMVIELRDQIEAPVPAMPHALRLPNYDATAPLPETGQRAVFACRSGLRAWRAANLLRERWSGEIALLALQGEDE